MKIYFNIVAHAPVGVCDSRRDRVLRVAVKYTSLSPQGSFVDKSGVRAVLVPHTPT
jgi:hypothetical protein